MKVVINKCYGGFGISAEAVKELVIRKANCVNSYTPKSYYGGDNEKFNGKDKWEEEWKKELSEYEDIGDGFKAHKFAYNIFKDGLLYDLSDKHEDSVRSNEDLVAVVEALGDKANGSCAKLKVIDVPEGISWYITNYDGMEAVAETHRTWG